MGFVIGVLAIALVLFMILAMALAEWADKDPGDLIRMLLPKRASGAATPSAVTAETAPVSAAQKKPAVRAAQVKDDLGSSSLKRTKTKTAKRKSK